MNILAIDPSSTKSGVCLILNDKPSFIDIFESDKTQDIGLRLYDFGRYLQKIKNKNKLDLVAVEQVGMIRNATTVRLLSYFTSVPLIKAGEWNVRTFQVRTTSARKIVFGKGNLDKQQVYDLLKNRYKLLEYKKGGSDQSDAITIGLAALEQ